MFVNILNGKNGKRYEVILDGELRFESLVAVNSGLIFDDYADVRIKRSELQTNYTMANWNDETMRLVNQFALCKRSMLKSIFDEIKESDSAYIEYLELFKANDNLVYEVISNK